MVTFFPAGHMRVTAQAQQLLYFAFDTGLETTNVFNSPSAAGGGIAALNEVADTKLGTGVTAAGYSYLQTQASFPPVNPGWLQITMGNNVPFPYINNTYFFWGMGTNPGAPTVTAPMTEGAGWEINTDGKLRAVMYAGGVRTLAVDLSSTGTGIAFNKQPLDANVHYYTMFYRGDRTYWCIDSEDNVVAFTTTGAPGPNTNTMPAKLLAIAGPGNPAQSGTLTCNVIHISDTTAKSQQIADRNFPWRKLDIDTNGAMFVRQPSIDQTLINATAVTTTQTLADQTNSYYHGIKVVLNTTAIGTGSVTVLIQGRDFVSGTYYTILSGAAVTTNTTNIYTVFPGIAATANVAASDVLPHVWRVQVVANNANAATYTVGASLLA